MEIAKDCEQNAQAAADSFNNVSKLGAEVLQHFMASKNSSKGKAVVDALTSGMKVKECD